MRSPIALVVVLDAFGITTLEYLLDHFSGKVAFPNLAQLGLGTLLAERHQYRFKSFGGHAYAAKVIPAYATADSTTGHGEMMGVIDKRVYDLFPNGFPSAFIKELERRIGREIMFNQMAGGMEAIAQNMAEHAKTWRPIIYSSKCDPLAQIAMDEAVIPVPEQHRITDIALAVAQETGLPITRVIGRAYVRNPDGGFTRTANRHDAVPPIKGRTLVHVLRERNVWTVAVGKTADLVNTQYDDLVHLTDTAFIDPSLGIRFVHPQRKDTNPLNIQGVLNALVCAHSVYRPGGTFVFANLVDGDSLFGHTRDVEGALRSLEEVDRVLPLIRHSMRMGDLLILAVDHGMEHREDYGYHSKEPLPLLAERIGYHPNMCLGPLQIRTGEGLAEVGMLVAQIFNCVDEFRQAIVHISA